MEKKYQLKDFTKKLFCKDCYARHAREVREKKRQQLIDEGKLEAPIELPEGHRRCNRCKETKLQERVGTPLTENKINKPFLYHHVIYKLSCKLVLII